jgi:hypothetical protein
MRKSERCMELAEAYGDPSEASHQWLESRGTR